MIGENLKRIRKSKKITLQQLENKTGITNSYISAIENGKKNNPSQDVLERLAAALEVPVSAFFDNIDIRKIEKNNDIRGIERDRDLERIERARSKMSEKEKEKMMKVLEASFDDFFDD